MSTHPRLVTPARSVDDLSQSQLERFQRHLSLHGFGVEAQLSLLDARVLVIGAGGLGAPILTYLAAAGVGTIDVVDHDVVDRSNLHRQVIHSEQVIGESKASNAAAVMRGLHPEIVIHEHHEPITAENALELVRNCDVVVDGSDNFATRYVVSDACEIAEKPLISGSILRFAGQVSLFWSRPQLPGWDGELGPTYRDLYPEAPDPGEVPTCAEAGVLGVLPGVVGTLMATETIKLIAGIGKTLLGRVLVYDALTATFREMALARDPQREPVTTIGADVASSSDAEPPREEALRINPFTGAPFAEDEVTPREAASALREGRAAGVLDVREGWEHSMGHLDGAQNLPLSVIRQGLAEVPGLAEATEERPLYVHCKAGVRSREAVDTILRAHPEAPIRSIIGPYTEVRDAL
ncbi:molybdopterin-synthase adenylyltransferase MoeB [Nesterenkonia aerolata]|uniref:Molybdopterin-synthase adenylyltransferase MoeB n=1 Tax=Nesterenkonia aerolata TaxID=3074079 RepID=A0ABU2DUE2_9MICC|nr:molybdopterin-synthase adenylyltransferase MoeB [Nesterenkonia sp. LY-0111]MDR8020128.1 molybdopterin-synthase adenylyltransferase MoeB [Nesterenkonia sp. LY-0111]